MLLLNFLVFNNCFSQSGWIQQNSGISANLNSVYFENTLTGWATGDGGNILKTTNGGIKWIQQASGFLNNLNSLFFTSFNKGYIVGDSGLVLKTNDGGNSWFRLSLIKPFYKFKTVFFVTDSIGYIGGIDIQFNFPNKIFKTVNEGTNWDSIQNSSETGNYINSLFFLNPFIGWKTGGNALVFGEGVEKTIDGGLNWIPQYNRIPPFNTVFFIDSLNGWLSAPSSVSVPAIFRTTNSGTNWVTEFPGIGNVVYSIHFVDQNNGWASAENNIIYHTTNGGINWIDQTPYQPGVNYRSVYFTDSLTGWVVGDSGVILKTTTGGILTGFSNTTTEIPDKFFLSQNYPNPFNPTTVISYELPVTGKARLILYDVLGNEVATIVNENKPAGSYEVEFEGSDLSSGLYYYSLSVDGVLIDTKRMLLLK